LHSLGRCSTIWGTVPALFCFSYFSGKVKCFLPMTSLGLWPSCLCWDYRFVSLCLIFWPLFIKALTPFMSILPLLPKDPSFKYHHIGAGFWGRNLRGTHKHLTHGKWKSKNEGMDDKYSRYPTSDTAKANTMGNRPPSLKVNSKKWVQKARWRGHIRKVNNVRC
jgi:hypothetical protein